MCKYEFLEKDLKEMMSSTEPTTWERRNYLDKFLERHKLHLKGYEYIPENG